MPVRGFSFSLLEKIIEQNEGLENKSCQHERLFKKIYIIKAVMTQATALLKKTVLSIYAICFKVSCICYTKFSIIQQLGFL